MKVLKVIGVGLLASFLLSAKNDGLIENAYPSLLGEYAFFKTVHDKKAQFPSDFQSVYTVTITRKDQLITEVDGKRKSRIKYQFIETKMPFLDDENHVLYGRKNHFQAMFYRGDTIIVENFPLEYQENYFVKIN
jgi:5'(3')-deoxyribonucleotidase